MFATNHELVYLICVLITRIYKVIFAEYANFVRKNYPMRKLRLLVFYILCLISYTASSQKIFSCNSRYDSDIKVFVTDSRYDADLLVFKTDSRYDTDGNKGLWFFVDSRYDADKKIWFADSRYDADLLIYFVDSRYDAGWRNKEKMHLLY